MNQSYTAAEEWKPIPGYEGRYEASSLGRIRSVRRTVTIVREYGGEVVIPIKKKNGYFFFNVRTADRRYAQLSIHRAVLLAFAGLPQTGQQGCHNNGIRSDNRAANLRWDSSKANHADKRLHGTHEFGEKHKGAKLTDAQVRDIKSSTKPLAELSRKYLVGLSTIGNIRSGRAWRHVK